MVNARTCEEMEAIREQIARDGYRVDPAAVAAAILSRLMAGRTLDADDESS